MKAIFQKILKVLIKVFSLVFGHKIKAVDHTELNIKVQEGDVEIDIKSNSLLDNEGTREIQ